MRDAGIVDQDGDGTEGLLGFVERADHGMAIGHVGGNRDGAAARRLDASLECREPIGATRDQRHRRALACQHLGKA